jgi:hypothetical protein
LRFDIWIKRSKRSHNDGSYHSKGGGATPLRSPIELDPGGTA